MDARVAPDHPTEELLFFVAGEVNELARKICRSMVIGLEQLDWVLEPPLYVDVVEEGYPSLGEPDVETVGCVLKIYASKGLPKEVDRRHLEEVRRIVEHLKGRSEELKMGFGVKFGHPAPGLIFLGMADCHLTSFLDAWERRLAQA